MSALERVLTSITWCVDHSQVSAGPGLAALDIAAVITLVACSNCVQTASLQCFNIAHCLTLRHGLTVAASSARKVDVFLSFITLGQIG